METIFEQGDFYIFVREDGRDTKRKSVQVKNYVKELYKRGHANVLEYIADSLLRAFNLKVQKEVKGSNCYTTRYRDMINLCERLREDCKANENEGSRDLGYCEQCGAIIQPWDNGRIECTVCGCERG